MNATEFERELNKLTEDLAEKYIKLRDLELAGYKDEYNIRDFMYVCNFCIICNIRYRR